MVERTILGRGCKQARHTHVSKQAHDGLSRPKEGVPSANESQASIQMLLVGGRSAPMQQGVRSYGGAVPAQC